LPEPKAPVIKAREAALRALVRVEQDGAYLNLAFPSILEGLPAEERALAVRMARGTVQRLNTLDWALNLFLRRSLDTMTPWIRNLLRLGAYQALYLENVPAYALVDQSVRLARRFGHRGVAGLVNAVLRRVAQNADQLPWPDRNSRPLEYISLAHSHPRWMVSRALERFGPERAENWCRANNTVPPVTIRPNFLKTTAEDLSEVLRREGFTAETSQQVPGMLRVSGPGSPAAAEAFRQGLFTVQGESSALVAPLTGALPGDTVVDLCSAPGGKTTHLAELTEDRGRIYAVEVNRNRLRLVEKAARRLGLNSIETVLADGREIERCGLSEPDAVMVDAPCSGLGVIRRLPEIKWRRKEESLIEFQKLQLQLLDGAASILPPGGKLLYSVCTTEPEETGRVIELFRHRRCDFELHPLPPLLPRPIQDNESEQNQSDTVFIWPHLHGLDGFFMALLVKKG